jgi:hypothetical protein
MFLYTKVSLSLHRDFSPLQSWSTILFFLIPSRRILSGTVAV